MKEGTVITKLVMLAITAALAIYLGVYLWYGMTDPLVTTFTYAYTVNDSVEEEGFLVRQEQVLTGADGIVDVSPGEGERVARGQTVAVIYRDDQALRRKQEIRDLELEIELLQYAMTLTDETAGTAELESAVVQGVTALRADTAAGDFDRLEEQVMALKQALLKRDYTYGQGVDPSRLTQLTGQLQQLRSQSDRETSQVRATVSGVFSAQVDGYESLLSPELAARMTPSQVLALAEEKVQENQGAVGKLITDSRWYLLAALPQEAAERVNEGGVLTVRFTGDFAQDVDMRVESVSKSEEGRSAVLLSSDRYLSSTTLLRRQTVEFIFGRHEGLRVPTSALHIITDQDGTAVSGVYAVVNGRAEFRKVEVLVEGTGFYVVRSLETDRTALRAADEIIVRARDLYDGKIVG